MKDLRVNTGKTKVMRCPVSKGHEVFSEQGS